ncbi:MAG TPA: 16S rRNA (guanine(527)-N(7))-methyltransferase RsmG [Treponemataceae bacterium]|nr:16S rRNA (guanine(527)-N(7))-methyltransferase RsmG [Treponemataceae bacterium]
MKKLLIEGLISIGFENTTIESLAKKVTAYVHELHMFNKAYDLCGARTKEDIIIKHIFDSLAATPHIQKIVADLKTSKATVSEEPNRDVQNKITIADIGSGGGLPGIPLAIVMPDVQFTLVERMRKRCIFLENCVAILGLDNVLILNEQAERIPQQSFDIAVFRAFRPLDKKSIRILLRILKKPNGRLIAYKARAEKIKTEMNMIDQWVPTYTVLPLSVPYMQDHERNLVVISS